MFIIFCHSVQFGFVILYMIIVIVSKKPSNLSSILLLYIYRNQNILLKHRHHRMHMCVCLWIESISTFSVYIWLYNSKKLNHLILLLFCHTSIKNYRINYTNLFAFKCAIRSVCVCLSLDFWKWKRLEFNRLL